jgi:hypothetical protein
MERWGVTTPEEAEAYMKKLTLADIGLEAFVSDTDTLVNMIAENGNLRHFYIELFEKIIFPVWFAHWEPQGIVETRENIENIYKQLQASNASQLGNMISWTNAALNASHQTGSMLEYVEIISGSDGLERFLNDLTEGSYTKTWNKELNEHGFYLEKKHSLKPKIQKLVQ